MHTADRVIRNEDLVSMEDMLNSGRLYIHDFPPSQYDSDTLWSALLDMYASITTHNSTIKMDLGSVDECSIENSPVIDEFLSEFKIHN